MLVTGGAGFIGSWLSEYLVREGALVKVLDNFQSGSMKNLNHVLDFINIVKGDVRNYEEVKKAVEEMDMIFHLAANANVYASILDPNYDFDTNALGTFNILKAVRERADNAIVIFTSSAAVYGEPMYTPIDEQHPLNPVSFYGASKLAGEAYCRAFYNIYGIKIVILRLFNVYGPRQSRYVMFDLLRKLSRDPTRIEVLGSGEQKRDFIYITDCVEALLIAASTPAAIGKTINIGSGIGITINQLVNILLELLELNGKTKVIYTGKSWEGDINTLVADVTLSQNLLGFRPKISLRSGLINLISWFKKSGF